MRIVAGVNSQDSLKQLLALVAQDGMHLTWCDVPVRDVVFVKALLEAYPGVVAVHAPPGRVLTERAPFALATTPGMRSMVDDLLEDLAAAADVRRSPPPPAFAEPAIATSDC